ncbi:MAG: hypothetical protein FJ291_25950 [Planctomycetes bacterium]|nr:hypothetical protein [Planctomycetota bacterium]
MLTSLQVEGYRGFAGRYTLRGFSQVNLLVGKNNCGKTSILEALHLLASGGDPKIVIETALRRGETVSVLEIPMSYSDYRTRSVTCPDATHFFHGHKLSSNSRFRLSAEGALGELVASVAAPSGRIAALPQVVDAQGSVHRRPDPALTLRIAGSLCPKGIEAPLLLLSAEGAVLGQLRDPQWEETVSDSQKRSPVRFLSPSASQSRLLRQTWDEVLRHGREREVIQAMQLLEPKLAGIFFLSEAGGDGNGSLAGILAALGDQGPRLPIGSLGEGVYRMLALSATLVQTAGGFLLVDEIDTGLHYSAMGEMWRLVVRTAKQSNVQVFATTHSLDCVRGLAWLCANYPDLGAEVSLQKIEPSIEQSVALDAEGIRITADQGIEVR